MRPSKVDADTVGEALLAAFRRSGYAGASLRDLGEASGLRSASLYHRFPDGKADMALAALRRAGEAFGALVLAPLADQRTPVEQLTVSAAGVARFYDDGRLGCLLAAMTLSSAPEPVREQVRAMLEGWAAALARSLQHAGVAHARTEAEDRIAAVQGALILARAGGGRGAFARAVERLAAA